MGNSGNFLFNLALESYLDSEKCDIDFCSIYDFATHSSDFVNNNYDMVLYSAANIINAKCKNFFIKAKEVIANYKIPIFFIGAGLETDVYDTEFKFLNSIKSELSDFIKAVDSVGGVFSIRGQRTAQVFKKLGFDNFYVTGCPSIFMLGPNLKIRPQVLSNSELKPLVNGTKCLRNGKITQIFSKYPESIFLCQDRFLKIIENRKKHPIKYSDLILSIQHGSIAPWLIKNDRIKFFKDIPIWFNYLKENSFNFSFGSRIHGNIICLLSGIPVLIYAQDMRVLEMAEYFDIPHIVKIDKSFDLYEQYKLLDYSKFNLTFESKFKNFQNFFDKYDIPCKVGRGIDDLISKNF